ncbi:hypothetical protein IC611_02870 [Proteus mirabilis]
MAVAKSQYQKTLDVRNKMAGTGATMTATGAGMLYSAKQTLMPGYEFNVGMSKVQALTRLDKNSDEFKMLREQARARCNHGIYRQPSGARSGILCNGGL